MDKVTNAVIENAPAHLIYMKLTPTFLTYVLIMTKINHDFEQSEFRKH